MTPAWNKEKFEHGLPDTGMTEHARVIVDWKNHLHENSLSLRELMISVPLTAYKYEIKSTVEKMEIYKAKAAQSRNVTLKSMP